MVYSYNARLHGNKKKKSNFPYMQTIWMEFTEVMLAKGVGTKEYMYDSACKNLKNRQN